MKITHIHRITLLTLFLISSVFATPLLLADESILNDQTGIVSLVVEDPEGQSVSDAPIYISDGHHTQVVLSDDRGTARLTLQAGHYTVSSSFSRPSPTYVDRFASPKAKVVIIPGDTSSVVLNLIPVNNPTADISLSTLHKMGVDTELAKYSN